MESRTQALHPSSHKLFCVNFPFPIQQLISNPGLLLPHVRYCLTREPSSHDAAPFSISVARTGEIPSPPVYESEHCVPAHADGLRCRNGTPKPFLIQCNETCASCALIRITASQVIMTSAIIQACLVFALCGALASTCQGATVFGNTLRETPSIGLGGNLSDVARLQKDMVRSIVAIFGALTCRQRLTESCVMT